MRGGWSGRGEWSIRDLAAVAGVSSRTLRHYEQVGLLTPARVAATGYRFYGEREVVRPYRILSLRSWGMPLPAIRALLDDEQSLAGAARAHLGLLDEQRRQVELQISAVTADVAANEAGEIVNMDELFGTVDQARYEPEVRERWGDDAWQRAQRRRDAMTPAELAADRRRTVELTQALRDAALAGEDPTGEEFQRLIGEHHAWVADQWGGRVPNREAYLGLAELYVADQRFAAAYGGQAGARAVRAAVVHWARTHLGPDDA